MSHLSTSSNAAGAGTGLRSSLKDRYAYLKSLNKLQLLLPGAGVLALPSRRWHDSLCPPRSWRAMVAVFFKKSR